MYQNVIIPHLYEAQHVSGNTPPIIRSLKLLAASGFSYMEVVGHAAGGRCRAQCTQQRPPATCPSTFHV